MKCIDCKYVEVETVVTNVETGKSFPDICRCKLKNNERILGRIAQLDIECTLINEDNTLTIEGKKMLMESSL